MGVVHICLNLKLNFDEFGRTYVIFVEFVLLVLVFFDGCVFFANHTTRVCENYKSVLSFISLFVFVDFKRGF